MHHNVRRAGILSLAMLIACATGWHPVATETVAAGSARVYPRLLVVTTDGYRPAGFWERTAPFAARDLNEEVDAG